MTQPSASMRLVARGSVLMLCLMLLIALTLLGLAAASDRDLQQRISANTTHATEASIHASLGLRWAEDWLFSRSGDTPIAACQHRCAPGVPVLSETQLPGPPESLPGDWWHDHALPGGVEPLADRVLDATLSALPARWLITEIDTAITDPPGSPAETRYYRVLARGAALDGGSFAVLESIVARPWNRTEWTDPLPRPAGSADFCRAERLQPCGRLAWRQLR